MGYVFNPFTGNFDAVSVDTVDIGDAIGNSPDSNGILYVDGSGNLQNDLIEQRQIDYFGGAVTSQQMNSSENTTLRLGFVNLSGIGQPSGMSFATDASTVMQTFWIDTDSLTAYALMNINAPSPADSFFGLGFGAGGLSSVQTFFVNGTGMSATVPFTLSSSLIVNNSGSLTLNSTTSVSSILDEDTMSSDSATALATQQSIKAYVDANAGAVDSVNGYTGTVVLGIDDVAPTQTGNSGKYLTTDGTNASWGTITLPTPGGSNTQIQYNDSGSFGGSSSLTWNNSTGTLTATGRYVKFGGGTASVSANGFLYKNSTVIDAASGYVRGAEFNPYVRATANNDELVGTYFTFTPDENSFTGLNQYMVYYQNTYANAVPLKIRAAPSQSADILQIVDNSNSDVFTISNVGRYYQTLFAGNLTETLGSAMSTEARSGYTSAGTTYARYLNFITANSSSSSYWGEYVYVQTDGSGAISVDDMGGIDTFVYFTPGSGTAQDLFGHRIRLGSTGTSSQNGYNIYVRDPTGSTMANLYGLYIENMTDGTSSNYAIYTNAGKVRFGDQLQLSASTTSRATLNIPSGTAPTTPVDGDIWSDGSDIKVRLGGTTYTLTKA